VDANPVAQTATVTYDPSRTSGGGAGRLATRLSVIFYSAKEKLDDTWLALIREHAEAWRSHAGVVGAVRLRSE
jgi:hypothetical protein